MKAKLICFWAMISLTVLAFAACSKPQPALTIVPEITDYSPAMSSTPGIPLNAVYTRDLKNSDYKFHWIAEEGTFLKWNDGTGSGRIQPLGADVLTNVHKVFWALDNGRSIASQAFFLHLTVEELATGRILDEARLEIRQREPGHFTIQGVNP